MTTALHLPVTPGDRLQIQCRGMDARINTRVIGVDPGQYVIAALPPYDQIEPGCDPRVVGMRLIVRYIHEGVAYGFESVVTGYLVSPARLLFLSYPHHVANHELRSHPRIECILPADLALCSQLLEGVVTNLSRDGCAMMLENLTDENLRLAAGESARVNLQLPGEERFIPIEGKIRSIRPEERGMLFGIQFMLSPASRRSLYAYLLTVGALPEHREFSTLLGRHLLWLAQVSAFAEGKLTDPPVGISAPNCLFGQWLEGEAAVRYAGMPQLAALQAAHAELHRKLAGAVKNPGAGKITPDAVEPLTALLVELVIAIEGEE